MTIRTNLKYSDYKSSNPVSFHESQTAKECAGSPSWINRALSMSLVPWQLHWICLMYNLVVLCQDEWLSEASLYARLGVE